MAAFVQIYIEKIKIRANGSHLSSCIMIESGFLIWVNLPTFAV